MLDANVFISAILFPQSSVDKVFRHVINNHTLLLSKYTLNEVEMVFARKFPEKTSYLYSFLTTLDFEFVNLELKNFEDYPQNRDKSDIPVLAYAIESKADIFITGDKDFDEIKTSDVEILKPVDYIRKYMQNLLQ